MKYLTLTLKLKVDAHDPKVGEIQKALSEYGDVISIDVTAYREPKAP